MTMPHALLVLGDFLFMDIRWIIHYNDGKTKISNWDSSISFKEATSDEITSMQLQDEKGSLYTLSSKKNQKSTFWQQDKYINKDLFSRSILRRLAKDIWLKLSLDINGNKEISIVKDKIKVT